MTDDNDNKKQPGRTPKNRSWRWKQQISLFFFLPGFLAWNLSIILAEYKIHCVGSDSFSMADPCSFSSSGCRSGFCSDRLRIIRDSLITNIYPSTLVSFNTDKSCPQNMDKYARFYCSTLAIYIIYPTMEKKHRGRLWSKYEKVESGCIQVTMCARLSYFSSGKRQAIPSAQHLNVAKRKLWEQRA